MQNGVFLFFHRFPIKTKENHGKSQHHADTADDGDVNGATHQKEQGDGNEQQEGEGKDKGEG